METKTYARTDKATVATIQRKLILNINIVSKLVDKYWPKGVNRPGKLN